MGPWGPRERPRSCSLSGSGGKCLSSPSPFHDSCSVGVGKRKKDRAPLASPQSGLLPFSGFLLVLSEAWGSRGRIHRGDGSCFPPGTPIPSTQATISRQSLLTVPSTWTVAPLPFSTCPRPALCPHPAPPSRAPLARPPKGVSPRPLSKARKRPTLTSPDPCTPSAGGEGGGRGGGRGLSWKIDSLESRSPSITAKGLAAGEQGGTHGP